MQHPLTALWRAMPGASRSTRRAWVVAAFAGFPLLQIGYPVLVASNRVPQLVWAPIAVLLFSATLAGVVAIHGFARDRASMTADLDERQRVVRDQAWIGAYGVLTAVVVLVTGLLAVFASTSGPVTIGMDALTPIGIGLGLYLPVLPSAALAWSEPDLPNELAERADLRVGR